MLAGVPGGQLGERAGRRERCTQFGCPGGWSAMDQYEIAYANRYVGPDFRKVIR